MRKSYLVNFNTGQVRAFTTANGIPTAVTGNPFASGLTAAIDGVVHPSGNFYVAADRVGNQVGSYQISGSGAETTLSAVTGSPFASGGLFTNALVFDQAGTFLFASNSNSRNITTYNVEPTTGVLTVSNILPINALGATGKLAGIDYYSQTPAASTFSVSGKVLNATNKALSRATVTATDASGNVRTTTTTRAGNFILADLIAGETYTFQARAKGYSFNQQTITVTSNLTNINFTANS